MSRDLLGIPPAVLAGVNTDYAAWSRGPATLDAALHGLLLDTVLSRYKALLTLYGTREAATRSNSAQWAALAREETITENRQMRRGGNR